MEGNPMYHVAKKLQYKLSIRLAVLSVFILTNILIVGIALGLQYYFSKQMATDSAFNYYDTTASQTADYLQRIDEQALSSTKFLSQIPQLIQENDIGQSTQQLFTQVLQSSSSFYSVLIGFDNGDLYQVINLALSSDVRRNLNAAPSDRWLVVHVNVNNGKRVRHTFYYDEAFNLRVSHQESSDYDASTRPWFTNAKLGDVHKTRPYLFKSLQSPGQTYSSVIPGTNSVVAIDIALSSLSTYLKKQKLSDEGQIYLYQKTGEIVASNQKSQLQATLSTIKHVNLTQVQQDYLVNNNTVKISNSTDWSPIDFSIAGKPQGYAIDVLAIVEASAGIKFDYVNGRTWPELMDMYKNGQLDALPAVYLNEENEALGHLSDTILDLPFSVVTKPKIEPISKIDQLFGKKIAITQGWSFSDILRKNYPQINLVEVPLLKDVIDAVRQGDVYAGIDSKLILQHTAQQFFIEGLAFHPALDFGAFKVPSSLHLVAKDQQLVDIINLALAQITPAIKKQLDEKWGVNSQRKNSTITNGVVPYYQLITLANQPQLHNKLTIHEIDGQSYFVYIKPIATNSGDIFSVIMPVDAIIGASLIKIKWSILITGGCLFIMLMLTWLFVAPIVAPIRELSRQNKKIRQRKYDEITHTPSRIIELDQLSQSMIEMASSIEQHEKDQKNLLDSFIKIICQAIDDKSHYTGGHCERMPELALKLAKAASESEQPEFSAFEFNSDDEIREFTIAAWLHDCGKITTPVHIVDKGTKLEVIYNRIHEIRMRFEVLWRDAEIEYLKQLAKAPDRQEQLQLLMNATKAQLQDDYAFVAQANVGGEFMDKKHVDRLKSLTELTWQRNFDNRLGLSPIEEERHDMTKRPLPATESLLADKAEHIVVRTKAVEFPPEFNIKMEVPEHESNQGEIHNLSIGRGTLTAEDRYIINEHIISTIKMLEALPLPPELSRVSQYASTHHETLKGTGYPRKLSAKDLSTPERVLVIADIFEALTAADRPYKKAKPVSVAIDILHKMALDQHIDIDLFELLLTSGLYHDYALSCMPESQIDDVDISQYIRSKTKTAFADEVL
jgi:HD-GYP domain-containing protein (c-di-GMP phosphodiesterase class II)/ABC-type amino acid transport substrate-binding protein